MSEIVLNMDNLRSYSEIPICRICHEEEFESCKSLETPCSCSGTVKFAHRDCVQRWCNEKGNTVCEICLQKFESGYISPPKKIQQIDTMVTIRESLEMPRNEQQQQNQGEIIETDDHEPECASFAANRSASCCRILALILTGLLLIRHLFVVITIGEGAYPYSFLTVVIVKASGIVLPMYILIRISAALHNSIINHHQIYEDEGEEQHRI